MVDINQFQNIVLQAYSPINENLSPQIKGECQQTLTQWAQDLNILQFCFQNFFSFQSVPSQVYTLKIIRVWLKERHETQGFHDTFKGFLFSQMFEERYGQMADETKNAFVKAQAMFVFQFYPVEFLQIVQGKPYEIDFYWAYSKVICDVTPTTYQKISELKAKLNQSPIFQEMYKKIMETIPQAPANAYRAASTFAGWANPQILYSQEFIQALGQGLNSPPCVSFVFDTYRALINRTVDDNTKLQLISTVINLNQIPQFFQINDPRVSISISKVIDQLLMLTNNPDYFQFALNILQLPNQAPRHVVRSIYNFSAQNPGVAEALTNSVLNKLIQIFGSNCLDFRTLISQATRYCSLLECVSLFNFQGVFQLLQNVAQGLDIDKNPHLCSALAFTVCHLYKKMPQIIEQQLPNYLALFKQLLLNPRGSNEYLIFLTTLSYSLESQAIRQKLDGEIRNGIINMITMLVKQNQVPPFISYNLSCSLQQFTQYNLSVNNNKYILQDFELITSLLYSTQNGFIRSAAFLLNTIENPQQRNGVLSQIIDQLYARIQQEQSQESFKSALIFLHGVNVDQEIMGKIIQLLTNINNPVSQNDELLSYYIQTVAKFTFDQTMQQIFFNIPNVAKGSMSNAALALCSNKFLNNVSDANAFQGIVIHLCNYVPSLINSFILFKPNEENNYIFKYYHQCITEFFKFMISFFTKMIPDDIIKLMFDNVNFILKSRYDSHVLLDAALMFCNAMAASQQFYVFVTQNFTLPSLYILFNKSINFHEPWANTLNNLYKFHIMLSQKQQFDPNTFQNAFLQGFQFFGAQELLQQYFSIAGEQNDYARSELLRRSFQQMYDVFQKILNQ